MPSISVPLHIGINAHGLRPQAVSTCSSERNSKIRCVKEMVLSMPFWIVFCSTSASSVASSFSTARACSVAHDASLIDYHCLQGASIPTVSINVSYCKHLPTAYTCIAGAHLPPPPPPCRKRSLPRSVPLSRCSGEQQQQSPSQTTLGDLPYQHMPQDQAQSWGWALCPCLNPHHYLRALNPQGYHPHQQLHRYPLGHPDQQQQQQWQQQHRQRQQH